MCVHPDVQLGGVLDGHVVPPRGGHLVARDVLICRLVVEVGRLTPTIGGHRVHREWDSGDYVDRVHPTALCPVSDHALEAGLLGRDVADGDVEGVVVGGYAVQSGMQDHLVHALGCRHSEHLARSTSECVPVVRAPARVVVYRT